MLTSFRAVKKLEARLKSQTCAVMSAAAAGIGDAKSKWGAELMNRANGCAEEEKNAEPGRKKYRFDDPWNYVEAENVSRAQRLAIQRVLLTEQGMQSSSACIYLRVCHLQGMCAHLAALARLTAVHRAASPRALAARRGKRCRAARCIAARAPMLTAARSLILTHVAMAQRTSCTIVTTTVGTKF